MGETLSSEWFQYVTVAEQEKGFPCNSAYTMGNQY